MFLSASKPVLLANRLKRAPLRDSKIELFSRVEYEEVSGVKIAFSCPYPLNLAAPAKKLGERSVSMAKQREERGKAVVQWFLRGAAGGFYASVGLAAEAVEKAKVHFNKRCVVCGSSKEHGDEPS